MASETRVQSHVKSYQWLKKWYLILPCLALSIIRYGSKVKWSIPGKGVVPFLTPLCCSYWKGSLWVTLDYSCQLLHTYKWVNFLQKFSRILKYHLKNPWGERMVWVRLCWVGWFITCQPLLGYIKLNSVFFSSNYMVSINYSNLVIIIILCLHTVVWFPGFQSNTNKICLTLWSNPNSYNHFRLERTIE